MSDKTELDIDAERASFEAWAKSESFDLRRPDKTYSNAVTSYTWQGWLAARCATIQPTADHVEKGVAALLQCTITELGDYSEKLMGGYEADVRRVFAAMVGETVAPADAVKDARNEALQFAECIISDALAGADWDGGAVQELAVQHGLLKPSEMQGPCGEDGHCACAQNGAEFPALCYRKTYLADLRATTKGPAK